jgi:hypothetical protein
VDGAKIGAVLNIRKPVRYVVTNGPAIGVGGIQDIAETYVPLVIDKQRKVAMDFLMSDLKLNMDAFRDRYVSPAVVELANDVDYSVLAEYVNFNNAVGTPGTIPNALLTYLTGGTKLQNGAVPGFGTGEWCAFLNPLMQATLVDALKGLFQSSEQIKRQYERGQMGMAAGLSFYWDQNINSHVLGAIAGSTPLVDTAGQTGSLILTDGWNAGVSTLKKGDVIQFAGVFGVNPKSRQSTGVLMDFRVTADTADVAGAMSIPIFPPIVTAGPDQTVTASPANNAPITVFGVGSAGFAAISGVTSPQGMIWHPEAITVGMVDLPTPQGVDMAARASDPDLGLSVRIIRDYEFGTDKLGTRVDILYGVKTLREEFACRVAA